jgi:hypothetical protein
MAKVYLQTTLQALLLSLVLELLYRVVALLGVNTTTWALLNPN